MNLFLELLQVSLGARDALSRAPSAVEWQEVLFEAQRQAIVGVLTSGIERLPIEQRPEKAFLLEWIGIEQMVKSFGRLNQERTKELQDIFSEAGYETCVLKGIAHARYYTEPLRRQCGDIDIWTNGRRADVMNWLKSHYVIGHQVWHNVAVNVFNDVLVEVHFHPACVYHPIHNWRIQDWFNSQFKEKMVSDEGIRIMPVEFDIVFSLVHSYRHLLAEGVGLRHVVDYYYILKNYNERSGYIWNQLHRFGLRKYAGAMMWVLQNVFGMPSEYLICNPDEKEGLFLLQEIMSAGNFGHQRKGKPLPVNSFRRYWIMVRHYPSDVLWMIPWKIWHLCWRMCNR